MVKAAAEKAGKASPAKATKAIKKTFPEKKKFTV